MVLNQIMPIINMKRAAQAAFSLAPPSSLYSSTPEFIFTESELSVYFLSLVGVRLPLLFVFCEVNEIAGSRAVSQLSRY